MRLPGGASARRRGRAVALTCVLALALAAAWWALWVPNVRPSLRADETYGIDVSNHQGHVDWAAVAADGISFAYVKASEGGDFTDQRFQENWAGTAGAGLPRGAYHFFTLCRPGAQQAEHFLRTVPPEAAALAPAVDLELAGNCSARPSREALQVELDEFLRRVEQAWGRTAVLYLGGDWESAYPQQQRSGRPLWLVSFLGRPDHEWSLWQLHGFARVAGVDGRVDLDVARGAPPG